MGRRLRAIDIYSGVGGWGLGLRMAGIDVVAAYDHWHAANDTNSKNNGHTTQTVDVRSLPLRALPTNIDIVVGSPPCTEFSFSNRGGNGDIDDGLEHVIKFLSIVAFLKPRAWAMENVPRMADILETELHSQRRLARFAKLGIRYEIFDMAQFGLPQRRRRCIAGSFDFDLLRSYAAATETITLGKVVKALGRVRNIRDPIYNLCIARSELRDHLPTDFLNDEELRINHARKQLHPVYNDMPFPDPLDRTVRTITAVCTRVSRESIIIEDPPHSGRVRRLTIRERACMQGFPVNFQFYGDSYGSKLRMVGNAVPPLFALYIGQAFRGVPRRKIRRPAQAIAAFGAPTMPSKDVLPDRRRASYPWERTFCFAIPTLRMKSGVRCELRNVQKSNMIGWKIALVFGTPRFIYELPFDPSLFDRMLPCLADRTAAKLKTRLDSVRTLIRTADVAHMQDVWSHRGPGGLRPFTLIDKLSDAAQDVIDLLARNEALARQILAASLDKSFGRKSKTLAGAAKLSRNAPVVLAGILIGTVANVEFARHGMQPHPDLRMRRPMVRVRPKLKRAAHG
ncbi:MAG TPA: DNA cytosine methyltransferase [Candidatus Limnocylindrales bacterium]|nr:DNA cytosine methyltransferase [Candidatus Limnocylindrales bacterium]